MKIIFLLTLYIFSFNSYAITCYSKNHELSTNNQKVLEWKSQTANQYLNRGHIDGILIYNYSDNNGHHHYQVQIGNDHKDTIEVIYNISFGDIPQIPLGSHFEACGDYITSNAPSGGYPASPDGAIIHWVHKSKSPKKHDSGFVVVNGVLYGTKSGIKINSHD